MLNSQLWSECIKDPSTSVVLEKSGCWSDTVHHDLRRDSYSNVLGGSHSCVGHIVKNLMLV